MDPLAGVHQQTPLNQQLHPEHLLDTLQPSTPVHRADPSRHPSMPREGVCQRIGYKTESRRISGLLSQIPPQKGDTLGERRGPIEIIGIQEHEGLRENLPG